MARTASWRCSSLAWQARPTLLGGNGKIVDIRGYIDRHGRPFLLEVCNHGSRFAHGLARGGRIGQPETPQRTEDSHGLITSYHVPGLYVEDHSIDVPLDWRGLEPMLLAVGSTMRRGAMPAPIAGAPESIKLFYRVVCAPDRINDDLPLLLFLQGGPGGESPRPLSPTSDGWIEEAVKHFRVVLPDQRGTGRSSCVDGRTIKALGDRATAAGADTARSQADFLKRHLASSIVRDFEYLRLVGFGGKPWVTLGQSYGGFLTLSYLSLFPEGVAASFTCGGIPHVPASASEVYTHTFPRMAAKTQQYYDRYPADVERVAALADASRSKSPCCPTARR